jgi:hypothetical protein
MRKFVLIAAMVLASASAQAGQNHGLGLASNDDPAAATQPAPVDSDVPKYVERPSIVDPKAAPDRPKTDVRPDVKSDAKPGMRAEKRRHHVSIEARVIYELHRHGIYW